MAYRRRADGNHTHIADAFRVMGCQVEDTHSVGNGFPDMVVERGAQTRFIEVKDPAQKPSDRRLTKAEEKFRRWLGDRYVVVETTMDAHAVVAGMILKERLDGQARQD